MMNDWEIARELIVLRGSRGWTQQKLADEIGTTQRTVAAWEAGSSIPRKTMRVRIAQAFALPPDYFLQDDLPEPTQAEPPEAGRSGDLLDSIMKQFSEAVNSADLPISEEDQKSCLTECRRIFSDMLEQRDQDTQK